MKITKRNNTHNYITKDKSLVVSFPFYGKNYELLVSLDKCVRSTNCNTFWVSFSFNDIYCPKVDFNTSLVTFFITMVATENKPSIRDLEIMAYWEDTYDVGEFVDETIKCCWSTDSLNTWQQKNNYRGEIDRLGIDVPWHMLSSFIH